MLTDEEKARASSIMRMKATPEAPQPTTIQLARDRRARILEEMRVTSGDVAHAWRSLIEPGDVTVYLGDSDVIETTLANILAETDPALLAVVDRVSEGDQARHDVAIETAVWRDEAGARTRAEERVAMFVARRMRLRERARRPA
jgi:hypothetical protein